MQGRPVLPLPCCSKGGNNNTYCHDSTLNYLDWGAAGADADGLRRFTTHMIGLRKAHRELRRSTYVSEGDITWHGLVPGQPDWSEGSRFLALTVHHRRGGHGGLYVAFNTGHLPQLVQLPRWEGQSWQPLVDTGKVAPYDILVADERLPAVEVSASRAALGMWTQEHCYPMLPWSCIVLESVPEGAAAGMPGERRGAAAPAPPPPAASTSGAGSGDQAAGPSPRRKQRGATAAAAGGAASDNGGSVRSGGLGSLAVSARSLAAKIKEKATQGPAPRSAAKEAAAEEAEYQAALLENERLRQLLLQRKEGSAGAQ